MKSFASLSILLLPVVLAHGDSHGKPEAWKERKAGESDYAMRHVSQRQRPFSAGRSNCTDRSIYLDGHRASHVMMMTCLAYKSKLMQALAVTHSIPRVFSNCTISTGACAQRDN